MKKLFVHPDGRLRTGLISFFAFFIILGLTDLVFEVKKRSESEVVTVRHVFEETRDDVLPEVEEEVQPQKPVAEPAVSEVVDVPQPQEVKKVVVQEPEMAKKEMVEPETPQGKNPHPESMVTAQALPETKPLEKEQPAPVEPVEEMPKASSDLEHLVALLGEKEQAPVVQKGGRDFEISDDLRHLARKEKSTPSPIPPTSRDKFISSPPQNSEKKEVSANFTGTVVSKSEVRLDSKEYSEIFKSWRNAGSQDEGSTQLSFRVQNLRKNYKLLQMKPVVVRTSRYFDLLNGAPLPPEILQEYSSLQLVVEKPWQEWQPELKRVGVRPSDDFNVRYLMYESIDNAMQSRVNHAFTCAVSKELIPSETLSSEVEVVGRVFQISRDGGGQFGVFVPQTLRTKDGSKIAIPVEQCFAKSADVKMLIAAGVL